MDPLAVLMSRVWSKHVDDRDIEAALSSLIEKLSSLMKKDVHLPWIDEDEETKKFVDFWFGKKQKSDLRRLAFALNVLSMEAGPRRRAAFDLLKVAMSRIIITKSTGASLAHDVSHSRPHRVMTVSDFDVLSAFARSVKQVRSRIAATPKGASARVSIGDARELRGIGRQTADLVLTSPPYLNAIDYMRGHKLSLVWMGHSISSLRTIRSASIGAERKASDEHTARAESIQRAMVNVSDLESRNIAIVKRYSYDLLKMMHQISRVLKQDGRAILVVGNSCLKETFIRNSNGVIEAARLADLSLVSEIIRDLPSNSRYLPMPKQADSALGKRMRTESILTLRHTAA